jgi:hypothetical protein
LRWREGDGRRGSREIWFSAEKGLGGAMQARTRDVGAIRGAVAGDAGAIRGAAAT